MRDTNLRYDHNRQIKWNYLNAFYWPSPCFPRQCRGKNTTTKRWDPPFVANQGLILNIINQLALMIPVPFVSFQLNLWLLVKKKEGPTFSCRAHLNLNSHKMWQNNFNDAKPVPNYFFARFDRKNSRSKSPQTSASIPLVIKVLGWNCPPMIW